MKDQGKHISYRKQLEDQLSKAKKNVDEAYAQTLQDPSMININRLNNARMELKTIKSRIENFGKPAKGIEEYHLPNNHKL